MDTFRPLPKLVVAIGGRAGGLTAAGGGSHRPRKPIAPGRRPIPASAKHPPSAAAPQREAGWLRRRTGPTGRASSGRPSGSPSFYSASSLSYTRRRGRLWDTAWESRGVQPGQGRTGKPQPCYGCAQRGEAALLITKRRPEKVGTVASSWSGGRAPESASLGACGSRRRSPGCPPAAVERPVRPALRLSLRDASGLEGTRTHSKGRGGGCTRKRSCLRVSGSAEVRLPRRSLLFTPRIFPLASPTKRRGDLSLRSIDRSRPTFWLH